MTTSGCVNQLVSETWASLNLALMSATEDFIAFY